MHIRAMLSEADALSGIARGRVEIRGWAREPEDHRGRDEELRLAIPAGGRLDAARIVRAPR